MRIAVLANLMANAPTWKGMPPDQWDDLDSPRSINGIVNALRGAGHTAEFLEASLHPSHDVIQQLRDFRPDLCFNIAESHFGDGREAHIPSILEMLQIPYTGSKVTALALSLDKPLTKHVLAQYGLPTPEFQVFHRADMPLSSQFVDGAGRLRHALFVKPCREGTSMGISAANIVRSVDELRTQVDRLIVRYRQPVLVERYIEGREVMVGLVGNIVMSGAVSYTDEHGLYTRIPPGLTLLPPLEVKFEAFDAAEAGIYSNRIKTEFAVSFAEDHRYYCPAPLDPDLAHTLNLMAVTTFDAIGCLDFARVDFRLDAHDGDRPYILEVNPLPGLSPGISDLVLQAEVYGWGYDELINRIVDVATRRQVVDLSALHKS